jgi:hypothetical protein
MRWMGFRHPHGVVTLHADGVGALLQVCCFVDDQRRLWVAQVLDVSSRSSRPLLWSHTARASGCCVPSGLGSLACSAIVQQFLRGRSESGRRTNALARYCWSAGPNRPATRPSSSSSSPCQRAGSASTLWPAATV